MLQQKVSPLTQQTIQHCKQSILTSQSLFIIQNHLKTIRQTLCQQIFKNQINLVMNSGLHTILIDYSFWIINHINNNNTQYNYLPVLQQCLWILINLCMDQQGRTKELISSNIIKLTEEGLNLINIATYMNIKTAVDHQINYPNIIQLTLQIIGNLLGDNNLQTKLQYLKSETFYNFYKNHSTSMWNYKNNNGQNITWVLSNAFRNINHINIDQNNQILNIIQIYLPIIDKFLQIGPNYEPTNKNLYSILYAITKDWNFFQLQINQMISYRFAIQTERGKRSIINIFGNMASQSDFGVSAILQNQLLLPYILNTLKNNNETNFNEIKFMRSCGWILSNILAGTQMQIDYIVNTNPNFFNCIYEIFGINSNCQVLRQLVWAVSNMIRSSSQFAFQALYDSNILICLSQKLGLLLEQQNPTLAELYLQGIQSFIKKHNKRPQKFCIERNKKLIILKTLHTLKPHFRQQQKLERLQKSIFQLESIVAFNQLYSISI